MKTVKYDGSFRLRTPRQMASEIGVSVLSEDISH